MTAPTLATAQKVGGISFVLFEWGLPRRDRKLLHTHTEIFCIYLQLFLKAFPKNIIGNNGLALVAHE